MIQIVACSNATVSTLFHVWIHFALWCTPYLYGGGHYFRGKLKVKAPCRPAPFKRWDGAHRVNQPARHRGHRTPSSVRCSVNRLNRGLHSVHSHGQANFGTLHVPSCVRMPSPNYFFCGVWCDFFQTAMGYHVTVSREAYIIRTA